MNEQKLKIHMFMTYILPKKMHKKASETAVSEIDQNCTQMNILKKIGGPFVDLCHVCGFPTTGFIIITPLKTNECPLENSGWKTILSFWNGPFLGDMLVFGGVKHHFSKYLFGCFPVLI